MNDIRRNIGANYLSQAYVAAVSLLTLPAYTHLMGAEAYGLVGFYAMLQAWFQLLDAGLSAALAREASRYNSGTISPAVLIRLKQLLELVFGLLAFAGATGLALASEQMATGWLHVENLTIEQAALCVALMGPTVALRWLSSLQRSLIVGFEQQVWVGGLAALIATARFVLCIPIIYFFSGDPIAFFSYQIIVSMMEFIILKIKAKSLVPSNKNRKSADISELKPALYFVSQVAFTSIIWIILTQVDKLILSYSLTLSSFGYFTVAVQIASGITLLNTPISTAVLPLMTRQYAEGKLRDLSNSYRRFSQLVSVAILPATMVLIFFSFNILFAWTGNIEKSIEFSPILLLYGVGNSLMSLSSFIYYVQYAHGNARMHMIGNAIFLFVYLPLLYFSVLHYGALGAAAAWCAANVALLLIWVPFVHGRFLDFSFLAWLGRDILIVGAAASLPFFLLLPFDYAQLPRFGGLVLATVFGCLSMMAAILASSELRPALKNYLLSHLSRRDL
ncbi:MAG: polysaccharide biosynthesis protein [Sphingomonas sp.]|nr:MAG: polysaccharide biosynthesis protein [Sphingomonas sp.]